jgi:signal transduction histidine kinase
MLLAFAEHASLALTDARIVDSMRKAERAKDMFFAMASHELKTPLTVIMAALRTMEVHSASLPEEMRTELLASAYERAKDLQKLIDRLLHSGRAELAGERVQVALPDVVASAIRGFDKSRRVRVAPVPEVRVEIDADAVREVAGILLENALSHSDADADIFVKATFDAGHFELTVDNPGTLTDDDLRSLFAPFQRGSRAGSRGVGLGLYIAARLARAMNGDVHVDTSGGRVAFTLRIPCRTVDIRPPAVPQGRIEAPTHPSG